MSPVNAMPDLLQDLARPESYPPPRPREVSLRTTHISWVFLTEDHVFKVKRPVSLGFVDFSTTASRAHFCQEEVRLNAALAPGVYLGTVPIRRDERGFSFVGDGEVVDHAVWMRRLPDRQSATALLATGRLTPEHLEALAQRLAAFYATAPVIHTSEGVDAMAENLGENLAQLATFAPDPLDQLRLEAVSAAQRQDLARLRGTLENRTATGKVREGHGDLRLEHVYFPDEGGPLVIDRLEFSPRFRVGDVGLDIAFLVMELAAAGAASSAEYFLYRFARATGDFEQYLLTDFHAVYRALVRAKIACLLAHDPATPPDRVATKRTEAARLLGLAHAIALGRAPPLVVIAIGGVTGAGKSSLGEAMARRFGLPVVSSDVARKQLAGLRPTDRGDASLYQAANHARTYREILARAAFVLASGRSVILDASFQTPENRAGARQLAESHGARFLFVEAVCAPNTLRDRLRERAAFPHESDADEHVLEQMEATFTAPTELAADELLVCRGEDPESAKVDAIARRARLSNLTAPAA